LRRRHRPGRSDGGGDQAAGVAAGRWALRSAGGSALRTTCGSGHPVENNSGRD
jgi:hypothetical protein